MYAIVEISGKQYKVQNDAVVSVDQLKAGINDNITLDKVLLYADGDNVLIGQPYLSNVKVEATVVGNDRGKKVFGMKFKRRKNSATMIGHRRDLSQLKIKSVQVS